MVPDLAWAGLPGSTVLLDRQNFYLFLFFSFLVLGIEPQGLAHARQVLYHCLVLYPEPQVFVFILK
jgi:hypothetical protein